MWSGGHRHALDSGHREPRNAPGWTFATLDSLHGLSLYLFTSFSNSVYPEERDRVLHIINDYLELTDLLLQAHSMMCCHCELALLVPSLYRKETEG